MTFALSWRLLCKVHVCNMSLFDSRVKLWHKSGLPDVILHGVEKSSSLRIWYTYAAKCQDAVVINYGPLRTTWVTSCLINLKLNYQNNLLHLIYSTPF